MKISKRSKCVSKTLTLAVTGVALALASMSAFADRDKHHHRGESYTLQGPCAYLPADRATEFHGNPEKAKLLLGMAGNQWVVFNKVLQGFNVTEGRGDGTEPQYHDNQESGTDYWTLDKLNDPARRYYVQLIPPGQIRKQIKSGCLTLGNDEDRNFLPGNVQVKFDIFASTNYDLMKDLAANGFVEEAIPYIKNKLDLMVDETNTHGIGQGVSDYDRIYSIVMNLLDDCDHDMSGCMAGGDPGIRVSEVDHINEGVHAAINKLYRAMDNYVRTNAPMVDSDMNGTPDDVDALNAALAAVSTAQPGSPALTRWGGVAKDYSSLAMSRLNPANGRPSTDPAHTANCFYEGHATIPDGTLRLCEFAILNKSNTHETRVHHVETPDGILAGTADIGPVWTSELQYQLNRHVPVSGMDDAAGVDANGDPIGISRGVPTPASQTADGKVDSTDVNHPATYSIAVLATAKHRQRAKRFINYVRSPDGQQKYVDGGFIGLTDAEMAEGKCYELEAGVLTETARVDNRCDD